MIPNFRKLQKQLNIIINKIEKEAVENGEDIATDEFQGALGKLREELLKRKGLTLDDYNNEAQRLKEEKKKEDETEMEITIK